jgi:hypothetical protein
VSRLGGKIVRRLRIYRNRVRFELMRPEPGRAAIAARFGGRGAGGGFRGILERAVSAMPSFPAGAVPPDETVERMRGGLFHDCGHALDAARGIDWHLERHFGVRWRRRFVGSLADVWPGSDLVLLWHSNRMMFLLDLAAAYRATSDEGLARQWFRVVEGWCGQNPFMVGMNWRSPMEAGIRLVVWSLSLACLRGAQLPRERVCERILRSVARQADFLAGGFSLKHLPNNHLVAEAATLYAFATYWPTLDRASDWRSRSEEVLCEEARRQVLPDGFHYENSVNYHMFVLDFYLIYLLAKTLREEEPPRQILEAVARMADAATQLVSPAGRLPQVGDDSTDHFFALRSYGELERQTADVRFEALVKPAWADQLRKTDWGASLLDRSSPLHTNHVFQAAGIVVLRDAGSHFVMTAGPQHDRGFPDGHMHADAGSFELELDGAMVIVDSGTWLYAYDSSARDYFRGAAAHNAVLVDDVEPMTPGGAFEWKDVHRSGAVALDRETGRTVCTRRIPGRGGSLFQHRRVAFACGSSWVVADGLKPIRGDGKHAATSLLHTPFASASGHDTGTVTVGHGDGEYKIHLFSSTRPRCEVVQAPDRRAHYSRSYGDLQAGTTIRIGIDIGRGQWLVHVLGRSDEVSVEEISEGLRVRVGEAESRVALEEMDEG